MSVRPLWPDELIVQAERLAGRGAGQGKPRTADLRRAVSSAYYALFHELCLLATDRLLPGLGAGDPNYAQVTRWFMHSDLRALAEGVVNPNRAVSVALAGPHRDLVFIADAFIALQRERERADYDHTYDARKATSLGYVDQARDAIDRMRALSGAEDASAEAFLRLMFGATKIAKNR